MRVLTISALAVAMLAGAGAAQTRLFSFHGTGAGDRFGISVDAAGDVDGDGHGDVVVGAFWADPNGQNSGLLRVHSGLDGHLIWEVAGELAWDELGWVVAGAGDVNGDGTPDVITGAPLDDEGARIDCGSARVLSGKDGATIWSFFGDHSLDLFGSAVDGAGDVNADGYADLIVGRRYDDGNGQDAGQARVFSGRDGALLFEFNGTNVGDHLGWSVAGIGDVDGDRFDDFAIGVPQDDTVGVDAGMVLVCSGHSGSVVHTLFGESAGSQFGRSVAGVGDLDGDGLAELLVGAPYFSGPQYRSGRGYLLRGADGAVIRTFDGTLRNEFFPWCVAGLGDVDGDGTADYALSAWRSSANGVESGSAWVHSGGDHSLIGRIDGNSGGDRLGWSIAGAGDVDADGYHDVIVGAYLDDVNASGSGSAFVDSFATTANPPILQSRGAPCAGSDGRMPRIDVVGFAAIGHTFGLRLRGAPTQAAALLNLGAPISIPLDLLGAPGCGAYADPGGLNVARMTDAHGFASASVPLPTDPGLVGIRLDFQWLAQDRSANAIGFVFSDAIAITFGQ